MQASWPAAIGFILEDEGAELNISAGEPGGASKLGVSLTVLSEWRGLHGQPVATIDDVRNVTPDLASQIYRKKFADAIRFDDLPAGVDYRLLDICVNLGIGGGTRLFAALLGRWQGAAIGDLIPLAAAKAAAGLVHDLSAGFIAVKSLSPGWQKSGHGWSNRNTRALQRAIAMVAS